MFSKNIMQLEITSKLADMAIRLLLSIIIPLAIGFSVFSENIIPILYKNGSSEMVKTFSILILAIIPMSGNYIYGTLLTATGSLWAMNRIFVLILGINIVLIILLLPIFSIPGVALASLITQSLALFLQLSLCLKKQVVKFSISLILRTLIFSILTSLLIISIKFFLPFTSVNLPIIILIGLLFTGIAMVSTGMLSKKEWRHLYNETIS
jgi:O-antigen/teichoic acid export membrane protein